MTEAVYGSTGNVFVDLGFGDGEAAILHIGAQLMADLRESVRANGATHTKVAQQLGISLETGSYVIGPEALARQA